MAPYFAGGTLAELLAANEETGLLEVLYLKDIDTSK
jgi:hypothetical protein